MHTFYTNSVSPFSKALCELFIGADFFAMRSCIRVAGTRKTKLMQIKNIKFFRRHTSSPFNDPLLYIADCVSITFEHLKCNIKKDIIILS
jgi:hypothetical protein